MVPQLGGTHTCRNFSKIQEWTFERWAAWTNKRAHVENGRIIDYAGYGDGSGDDPVIPPDFHHTRDEM